ncbi:MAG: 3'-5' exonuclease [Thermoplasmata archaeon]
MGKEYFQFIRELSKIIDRKKVLSFDLETLVADSNGFLTNEEIIGISAAYNFPDVHTDVFISKPEDSVREESLLGKFDELLGNVQPQIIIGYNHTGYDIPLIQKKIRNRNFYNRFRNIEYFFGTSWCLDMMYVIAEDIQKLTGDYYIRKLDDVVVHERYSSLPLKRVKNLVVQPNRNKGEIIKEMWINKDERLRDYAAGDSHDILIIFHDIFQ